MHHDATEHPETTKPGRSAQGPLRWARKAIVGLAGVVVIAIGIVLIPLPGPGWLIVAGGLAILATEFPAARRQLDRLKAKARSLLDRGD